MADGPTARLQPTLTREVAPLEPKLLSFDVFGTLISVRDGSYGVFRSILADCARTDVCVQDFWEYWEERNIAHYWEPYRPYKEICELSLGEAFAHFGIRGNPSLIRRYFDASAASSSIPMFYRLSTCLAGVTGWPSSRTSTTIFWLRPRLAGSLT